MKKKIISILIALVALFPIAAACSPGDPIPGDIYTQNMYPGTPHMYSVGSSTYPYSEGYFDNLYMAGVLVADNVTGAGTTGNLVKWLSPSTVGNATNTDVQVAGAVANSHTQNTDTILTTNGVIQLINAGTLVNDLKTDRWAFDNNNTFLGVDVVGSDHLTGSRNTAFGYEGLKDITTGNDNTAVGWRAGRAITTGEHNTTVGDQALQAATSGVGNTAVGELALGSETTGNMNTAVGVDALWQNVGSNNTVLGATAGGNNLAGSGNVFIGANAGENEVGSNKLYIDNSNTATPLIGGDFSTNIATINGDLKVTTPSNVATSAVTTDGTQTLINKTLTNPNINEAVAMSVTSTNLNLVDDNDFLATIWKRQKPLYFFFTGGTQVLVGSAGAAPAGMVLNLNTGTTANSSGLYWNIARFLNTSGGSSAIVDFSKPITIIFNICRINSDVQVTAYYQLKGATTIGAMATKGIGLKVVNYEIWTETYGTALGNIDTGVVLTSNNAVRVMIVHTPSVPKVEYYIDVNGAGFILRATETTSANIPQSADTNASRLVGSVANGAAGGVDAYFFISPIFISQGTN